MVIVIINEANTNMRKFIRGAVFNVENSFIKTTHKSPLVKSKEIVYSVSLLLWNMDFGKN